MPSTTVPHAIVIGSGSGGLTAAVGLARMGRSAVMVEAAHIGGDCTNVGCIPSKSLLHHSKRGILTGPEVLAKVRERRTALRHHEEDEFGNLPGVDFRRGRARIAGPGRVEITSPDGQVDVLESPNIVIASGSSPRRLVIPDLPAELMWTNENLFEIAEPPRHLAIVGGGPIGVEMATAFTRLGSTVSLVEFAPQILPNMVPAAARILHESLVAMGVRIEVGARASSFEARTGALSLEPATGGPSTAVFSGVDAVLVAAGRIPNSDDLGLETVGVLTDDGGRIIIDDRGRTNISGIYACGDVTDRGGTTHAAGAWGRRILRSMIAGRLPQPDVPPMPGAVFGDPEAAWVGHQPVDPPPDVRRIHVDVATIDRAYTDEVTSGAVIIDVRRLSGRIMGATIVGPRAGELIGTVSLAMKTGVPFHKWYGVVWPYPTYSDGLSKAVDLYVAEALPSLHTDALRWLTGRVRSVIGRGS